MSNLSKPTLAYTGMVWHLVQKMAIFSLCPLIYATSNNVVAQEKPIPPQLFFPQSPHPAAFISVYPSGHRRVFAYCAHSATEQKKKGNCQNGLMILWGRGENISTVELNNMTMWVIKILPHVHMLHWSSRLLRMDSLLLLSVKYAFTLCLCCCFRIRNASLLYRLSILGVVIIVNIIVIYVYSLIFTSDYNIQGYTTQSKRQLLPSQKKSSIQ